MQENQSVNIIAWLPILSLILIPYLTHAYAVSRERHARLHSIISELQGVFDNINELFFESVESSKESIEEQKKDVIREQKIIIQLEKIDLICKRASKLLKNTDGKFHQVETSAIRKIATNDRRRTPELMIDSSRELYESQNAITNLLIDKTIKGMLNFI